MITIYLTPEQRNQPISNFVLARDVEDLCKLTGQDWQICETEFTTGYWWWKKVHKRYSLMVISGIDLSEKKLCPYKPVIFHSERSPGGTSPDVRADTIFAWIDGYFESWRVDENMRKWRNEENLKPSQPQ